MDAGIEINIELGNRAGNLRPNLHRDDGINRAGGFHDIVNVPAIHLGGKVFDLAASVKTEICDEEQNRDGNTTGSNLVDRYIAPCSLRTDSPLALGHGHRPLLRI